VIDGEARRDARDVKRTAAVLGELERVRQEVLEDLLQALRVGDDAAPERRVDADVERQAAVLGVVPEHAGDGVVQRGEEELLGLDGDGARLDLRQIEDVADEVQEVGAGAGMVRANSTCLPERLPSGFSASCGPRMRMLLRGVRSSCDMFARNSDLYFEVRPAPSPSPRGAARLARSPGSCARLGVLLGQLLGLERELLVGLLELLLLVCSSVPASATARGGPRSASSPRCLLSTMPMLLVS
jgi:hypothetical protein